MASVIALTGAGVACSGAGPTSGGTTGGSGTDARIGTVQAALAQPTAEVAPDTLKALLAHWQAFQRARPALDAVLFVTSDIARPCLAGSPDSGAYDLSCLTRGRVSGRLTFEAQGTATEIGFQGRVDATLEDACAGDACVNATVTLDIVPAAACAPLGTMAVTATVSSSGATDTFSIGGQGGIGRGQLNGHVAYFDADERSLLVDGDGQPSAPGPYLVSGANRSFECTFLDHGGHCDGATSFAF